MAGTSNYPGALDNFSAASPTNLGDDDATGRNHGERHDDLEAAVEAIQGELGVNPAGTATTVVARLDGLDSSKAPVANPTFSGAAAFPDGSASAPSVTNDGDTNTGLFFPAADTVAVATGGSERLRVDSSGRTLIGPTSSRSDFFNGSSSPSGLQVEGTGYTGASISVVRNSNDNACAFLTLGKSRASSLGGTALVSNNDRVGAVSFQGSDGSELVEAARIEAYVDGTAAANDMPGRLSLAITADGAASTTERMRLDSNGLITGTGTSLGAWTAYTPTLGGTGWAIGDGTATGAYCRIGKLVVFRAKIVFGSTSTYGAGSFDLTLPVTASSGAEAIIGRGRFTDTGTATYGADLIIQSTTQVTCRINGTNGLWGVPSSSSPFTWASTDIIAINGVYEAA